MTVITRVHDTPDVRSSAVYSPCCRYRYALTRTWDDSGKRLLYVMLNPSKATEVANDPTVERCERRARKLGYGAMRVCNLFAWCETDPARLKAAVAPTGDANDRTLSQAATWADTILCAWGVHGVHHRRDRVVARLLFGEGRPLWCLGKTKDGHPRHPLYVKYDQAPVCWSPYYAAAD